jgi:hypothetical protein
VLRGCGGCVFQAQKSPALWEGPGVPVLAEVKLTHMRGYFDGGFKPGVWF